MPQPDSNVIAAIKQVYAAINSGQTSRAALFFDPQIKRIEFEGFPMAGTYTGPEAVLQHFASARATWAEGSCQPEQFFVSGNKIVVIVHVSVRLKTSENWIKAYLADVFTFRNDKIIEMYTFAEKEQAFAWAGVEENT
jgi:uncharacterized protein